MNKATLLTGDLDFKPLLDALIFEGMHISIQYSRRSISKELLYAADNSFRITIKQIYDWIPDQIKNEFAMPSFHSNLYIENAKLIKQGYSDDLQIYLYQRRR